MPSSIAEAQILWMGSNLSFIATTAGLYSGRARYGFRESCLSSGWKEGSYAGEVGQIGQIGKSDGTDSKPAARRDFDQRPPRGNNHRTDDANAFMPDPEGGPARLPTIWRRT